MSDRQQDQDNIHDISEHSAGHTSAGEDNFGRSIARVAVPFRLTADFVVEAETAENFLHKPDLTPEERGLFLTILATPKALNRVCRLAIVCDLEADPSGYFEETFMGPEPRDILDCVLPYLSTELQEYWTRLQRENYDSFAFRIDDIFQQFCSSLKKTVVQDMTTNEAIPLRIGDKDDAAA